MNKNTLELIWTLARYDFKLRFNGSYLGIVWSLLKPALIYMVLYIVFSNIFKSQIEHFAAWLLTGFVLWDYFSDATVFGLQALQIKSYLITKIYTKKRIIIISNLVFTTIFFFIKLIILAFLFVIDGVHPSVLAILNFFYLIFLMGILVSGYSLVSAFLYLKYRDLVHIWEVFLIAGFYLSPIIYPIKILPELLQKVVYMNPMTSIIQFSKDALFDNQFHSFREYGILTMAYIGFFMLSYYIALKIKDKSVECI